MKWEVGSREAHRRYGLRAASLLSVNPELERLLRRDLAARVGKMTGSGKLAFRPLLAMGRLADHLIEEAEGERADLIVVGTHHHRGIARLASVARRDPPHGSHGSGPGAQCGREGAAPKASPTVKRV